MSGKIGRVRTDREGLTILDKLLFAERSRLIAEKIDVRDNQGGDVSKLRRELEVINRLMQEVHRTMNDVEEE